MESKEFYLNNGFKVIPNYEDYLINKDGKIISFKHKEPKELKWYVFDGLKFGGIVSLSKNGKVKKFNVVELIELTFKEV